MGTRWLTLWLAGLLLAAEACVGGTVEPAATAGTAAATVVSAPTAAAAAMVASAPTGTAAATAKPRTATPLATDTASPSGTAGPSETASPSGTASPEPTARATAEPTATALPEGPLVYIGETVYVVELALTAEERSLGLSHRASLADDRGMLFVYDEDGGRAFWMPYMNFPLDMVWIRADCTVAGVTADVPHPDPETPLSDLPHYPSNEPARFILEINAGQAAAYDIIPDSPVKFGGEIAGKWGC